jgi:hypothetical protein
MPTNYPTSLDNFTNPTANDSLNIPSHSLQHANANDAIEAIEAKLGVGNDHKVGLYNIVNLSFTNATSVPVQSCFSANYTDYRIIVDITSTNASGQNGIGLLSGSTQANLNYNSAGVGFGSGAAAANNANEGGTNEMRWGSRGSNGSSFTIDILNPFIATQTRFLGNNLAYGGASPIVTSSAFAGVHTVISSYDGFILWFLQANGSTGNTASGNVNVYGYRTS